MDYPSKTPLWQADLFQYLDAIPYGDVTVKVTRAERRTVQITTAAEETIKYRDNDAAVRDLNRLIARLIEEKFTGEAHVRLVVKDGNIDLLGVFDKKQTKY